MAREVLTVAVDGADEGSRLDRWFRRQFPQVTQGHLHKLLRSGQVRVDGKRAKGDFRLAAGQIVRVPPLPDAPAPEAPPKPANARDLEALEAMVLYRDDHVLALDKPAGLAVQGGSGTRRHLDGMLAAWERDGERPRLVHRLDRDTAGVMLVARSVAAARSLTRALKAREARKIYWAVTVGVPDPRQGRISQGLAKRGGAGAERMAVDDADGKPAITFYTVVEEAFRKAAWVALMPKTGRTHQLRVHLASLQTPILGDGKYAGQEAFIAGAELPRQLHLFSRRIAVPHPATGRLLTVTAPLPAHMTETWDYFGFSSKPDEEDPFPED